MVSSEFSTFVFDFGTDVEGGDLGACGYCSCSVWMT